MSHAMSRLTSKAMSLHVNTALADTTALSMAGYAGGRVYIPAGSSVTSLTFYDAPYAEGTFVASYDDTTTTPVAIALTGLSAEKSYPIPAKMFGAGAIKMVSNADGVVDVCLKG